jgi:hypothetical protein
MDKKIHQTHFTVPKDAPWKRPITISLLEKGTVKCDLCDDWAEYGANGKVFCHDHWVKDK